MTISDSQNEHAFLQGSHVWLKDVKSSTHHINKSILQRSHHLTKLLCANSTAAAAKAPSADLTSCAAPSYLLAAIWVVFVQPK